MNETRTGLSRGIVTLLVAAGLLLCGFSTTAGFVLGRFTAPAAEVVAAAGEAPAVVVTVVVTAAGEALPEPAATPTPAAATATTVPAPATPTPPPTLPPAADEADTAPAGASSFSAADLDILWEAWTILERDYDGNVPSGADVADDLVAFAVSTLDDPFTRYIPPDVAARGRESRDGGFEGIGAFVDVDDEGRFVIVRPMDGQPADLAGLRAGDIVLAVDGVSITGMTIDETVNLVRGPKGTPVTLTIERDGEPEPFDITIIRDFIHVPVLETEMRPDGIAYVRLYTFAQVDVAEQFISAVDEMLAQQPRGMILDLRDNGGGLLDQTLLIGDYLLGEGILLQERNRQGLNVTYQTYAGDAGESIPLVVLVNEGSASASELLSGAIQDRDRGLIVGAATFGKGSVQVLWTLSNGAELRVTASRWFTPDNNSVDGVGITPDIIIETPLDLGGEDDPQLNQAVSYLLNGE